MERMEKEGRKRMKKELIPHEERKHYVLQSVLIRILKMKKDTPSGNCKILKKCNIQYEMAHRIVENWPSHNSPSASTGSKKYLEV